MEISLAKKIFTSLFFILFAFILLYIFSIWSSVFMLKGFSERLTYIDQQGYALQDPEMSDQVFSFGIHEGDIEVAVYSTIIAILLSIIPFLWGLFMYWRGDEKNRVARKVIISTFIFQFTGFLLMWLISFEQSLYFFPLPFRYQLQDFSVFFARFYPLLVVVAILQHAAYLILFLLLDKKFSMRLVIFALSVILLALSLVFPTKLYIYAGCNNYQDQYCISELATEKNDISICGKTATEFYKNDCIREYAKNKYDPSACSKLNNSIDSGIDKVSSQAQCVISLNKMIHVPPTDFFSRPHLVTLEEKQRNCDILGNSNERAFCKKISECTHQRYNSLYSQNIDIDYSWCITEAQQLLKTGE